MHIESNKKGFTLVELLVAMALTGIVAGAIFTAFQSQQKSYLVQDQVAEMQQNLRAAMDIMVRDIRMAGYDPIKRANAGIISASSNSIRFTEDLDGDGNASKYNEDITYSLYTSEGINKLGRKTPVTANNQPLAENIEAIGFAYAYSTGTTGKLATSPNGHVIWAVDTNGNGIWDNLDTDDNGTITAADGPGVGNNGVITGTDTGITANTKMIRAVRIWILARSANPDPNFRNTKTYVVGKNVITLNDGYRRRLLTTTVKCRNMGL